MKMIDGNMGGSEGLDAQISHVAVVRLLRGKTFGARLETAILNSQDYEQGLKVVFLTGVGKYVVVDMDDISPGSVGGGHVEPEDTSLFEVHTHPIGIGNSLHTIPSDVDLAPSFRDEGPFAKAIVVMGSNLQAWVWETPKTKYPANISKDWRRSLKRINDPSYSETEELLGQLQDSGLKIKRGDLKRDRLAYDLVDLMESMGIRFG